MERVITACRTIASPHWMLRTLAGTGAVLTGSLAAAIQGAPVPVDSLEILVPRDPGTLASVSAALQHLRASSPEVGPAWPGALADPDADPVSHWRGGGPDLTVRLVKPDAVAAAISVQLDPSIEASTRVLVMPLWQIESVDRATWRVLERMRARHRVRVS
jgi:hypothetical protein